MRGVIELSVALRRAPGSTLPRGATFASDATRLYGHLQCCVQDFTIPANDAARMARHLDQIMQVISGHQYREKPLASSLMHPRND